MSFRSYLAPPPSPSERLVCRRKCEERVSSAPIYLAVLPSGSRTLPLILSTPSVRRTVLFGMDEDEWYGPSYVRSMIACTHR